MTLTIGRWAQSIRGCLSRFVSTKAAICLVIKTVFLTTVGCSTPVFAQTKHALLIGINSYEPRGRALAKVEPVGPDGPTRFALLKWPDLEGAVNDVNAMKALLTGPKFGFMSSAVHVLLQGQATRDAILAAMRKYLVDEPTRGDIVVFYYAGHGSLRYNSKSIKRQDHLDNTIVPSDAYTGVFDVRDREISRIFNAALDKGVHLTAIFDSCHSGTIARGIPLGRLGVARFLPYDPRDIAEGPDTQNGKPIPGPEDRADNPALTFSATQPDQLAREWDYGGEAHGAFTVALIDALTSLPVDTSAKDMYARVKVVMEGMGLSDQQPMLDGPVSRQEQPLFGTQTAKTKPRVAVASVDFSGTIVMDAGRANNLGPGSELVRVSTDGRLDGTRVRIVQVDGLTRSGAQLITSGDGSPVRIGDLFELEKWVPLQEDLLRVWTPAPLATPQIEAAAKEFLALSASKKVEIIEDPALSAPAMMISWNGDQWVLSRAGSTKQQSLGANLHASSLARVITGQDGPLFLNLPPSAELSQQLRTAVGTNVQFVEEPGAAPYVLVGTMQQGLVRYAWVRRSALETAAHSDVEEDAQASVCSENSPYPMRTDWITLGGVDHVQDAALALSNLSSRLAKIHAWLNLPTPAIEDTRFPYRLSLRRISDGAFVSDAPVHEGETYQLLLKTDGPILQYISPRWVYVLDIDCSGQGKLLFPVAGGENRFPSEESEGQQIDLPMEGQSIEIAPPFGTDTFVLLTTDQQLPDPGVLNFDGVISRGVRSETPLQQLLESASGGSRGVTLAVPTDWSVQYLSVRSVGKKASRVPPSF